MRNIGARVYGDPDALDPLSGYAAKAFPAFYHTQRSVIKDCLPADDFRFPMIYGPNQPDRLSRAGDVEGPSVEYHLFVAGTGTDWTEEEFRLAASRVYTLERAVAVRHWGRDRAMDEMVLPSFEYLENWTNPMLGQRQALDRARFEPVMDEYYGHQGWDVETGWPTRERLAALGMGDVHAPMVEGARRAKASLPPPPPAEPVPLIHG
jgi:aldehyde:ferredoxin oxidoreductase